MKGHFKVAFSFEASGTTNRLGLPQFVASKYSAYKLDSTTRKNQKHFRHQRGLGAQLMTALGTNVKLVFMTFHFCF